jgi:bifunctional ADP-heptose synthase (sugar kinase/adenylyltransferase)
VTPLSDETLVKTRYVDRELGYPMFESKRLEIGAVRQDRLPDFDDYDLVLIADFGHGLLNAQLINQRIAARQRAFVAAMVQVNSSNYGYSLPIKYVGADYYSVNRTEAELCLHERGLPLPDLLARISGLLQCDLVSVTDGSRGMIVRKRETSFDLPTLSATVIDTIGCGDAYFALSSLAARLDRSARFIALAGGIGAAAMAQRQCNESPVTEQDFLTIAKIVI